jgi:hypothetical protein
MLLAVTDSFVSLVSDLNNMEPEYRGIPKPLKCLLVHGQGGSTTACTYTIPSADSCDIVDDSGDEPARMTTLRQLAGAARPPFSLRALHLATWAGQHKPDSNKPAHITMTRHPSIGCPCGSPRNLYCCTSRTRRAASCAAGAIGTRAQQANSYTTSKRLPVQLRRAGQRPHYEAGSSASRVYVRQQWNKPCPARSKDFSKATSGLCTTVRGWHSGQAGVHTAIRCARPGPC